MNGSATMPQSVGTDEGEDTGGDDELYISPAEHNGCSRHTCRIELLSACE